MLIIGKGKEKTEILKTLFELECAEGVTAPIMVSIAGSGHTFGLEADGFFSRLPRITVTYDGAGIVNLNGSDHCNGKGLLVNLTSSVKGSRAGVGYALNQLFNCHRTDLKAGIGLPLGSLLIDDLHQITDDFEFFEAAGAIREYAQSNSDTFRRLVATSEVDISKNRQSFFGMNFFFPVKLEQAKPVSANSEQTILVQGAKSSDLDLFPCESTSLADRSIVADICGWIWYLEARFGKIGVGNGISRAARFPGHSLWYSDLRASLIR
jgi:hypothetical protein